MVRKCFLLIFFSFIFLQTGFAQSPVQILNFGDEFVYVDKDVYRNLSFVYRSQTAEVPFCLHGKVQPDSVFIKKISFPNIVTSGETNTVYGRHSCLWEGNYIGIVHNHQSEFCLFSPTDYKNFYSDSYAKVNLLVCVSSKGLFFKSTTK